MTPRNNHSLRSNPIVGKLAGLSRHVVPISLGLTLLIGVADYVTSVEITFVMLAYLAPIALATWYRGRRFGLLVALIATAWTSAVFVRAEDLATVITVLFNAVGAFGMFLAMVVVLDRLRHYVEREQLQHRVAVEQLRHAERLNVIGTLAAGVAHELGTPLNVIAGTAELLDSDRLPPERVHHLTKIVLAQTDKISNIIRHLLEFGRRSGSSKELVELDRVTKGAIDLLGSTAAKHHVKLAFTGSHAAAKTRASTSELEQVVSNLILNGIQAMPDGGTVRVHTGCETRPDATGTARTYGCITVEDEGTGISDDDLPRIFDPFFTTKGVGEGTGLGLSVSYGIVQDHGGSIEVSSQLGRGTRFAVLLPLEA